MKTKEIILLALLVIMTILGIQQIQFFGKLNYHLDGSYTFCGLFPVVCVILWLSFFRYLITKKDKSQDLEREILTIENLKGAGCFVVFLLFVVVFGCCINWLNEQHSFRHLPERGRLESIIDNTCWDTNTQTLLINEKEYWFNDYETVLQIDEKLTQKIPCFHGDKFNPIPVVIKRMGKKIIPPWKYEKEVILLLSDE